MLISGATAELILKGAAVLGGMQTEHTVSVHDTKSILVSAALLDGGL